jgi:hypothetical protein
MAFLPFVLLVAGAALLADDGSGKAIALAILAAVLGFIAVLVYWSVWSHEQRRREAQALTDWGAPRGLARVTKEPDHGTSALFAGAVTFESVLRGPVVGARAGSVSHLAVHLKRRMPIVMLIPFWGAVAEGDVDLWTVAQVTLQADEAKPLGRLVLSRREVHDLPALAALRDRATSLRHVELESTELHDLYELEVADRADDVAVRKVFSPAFVVYLVERAGEPLLIELRKRTLTVALRGQLLQPAELDRLLDDVARVAAAVAPDTAREPTVAEPVAPAKVFGMSRGVRIASVVAGLVVIGGIFAFAAASILSSPG